MQFRYVCLAAAVFVITAGCSSDSDQDIAECVQRGVRYFKLIGSYPTLTAEPNAGRPAESVAQERCEHKITAF